MNSLRIRFEFVIKSFVDSTLKQFPILNSLSIRFQFALNFNKGSVNSSRFIGESDSIRLNSFGSKAKFGDDPLCNLKELHSAFKEKHPAVKIGFSKFCSLRPKWCLIAGSSGTHSVCVCTQHQNTVLLLDAIKWNITYKDLIEKVVCDSTNRECMIHRCSICPGSDALKMFLAEEFKELDPDVDLYFHQWQTTTDRAALVTQTASLDEYTALVIAAINSLTTHSYITKCQARYLKHKKENLAMNEAIVLGDFAENYQFIMQDEIQSYHWSNTLHPIVIYLLDREGHLKHDSLCFISDDNLHDTNFVYQVQAILVRYLKEKYSNITKLHYFSDGCAGQYKNYKNFINLCLHKEDFGLDAEWVFFATSHGKSPCDGIGGVVKRHVAKRSLQRPLENQILDYKSMIELCRDEIKEIKFFEISQLDMLNIRQHLKVRFEKGRTLPGTRSCHHFVPQSRCKISYKTTSDEENFSGSFALYNDKSQELDTTMFAVSQFVSCRYDTFWWIGMIENIDENASDLKIKFLHPHGPSKSFYWPSRDDTCYVPITNILCLISPPSTSTGRTYKILDDDYDNTVLQNSKTDLQ